jgi:hypothetical protein
MVTEGSYSWLPSVYQLADCKTVTGYRDTNYWVTDLRFKTITGKVQFQNAGFKYGLS